ncbi:MAG: NAD(P)-dependent oxidoreductase [Actinobacteria bacterium]|nr:NAD(P)-dependent oxidoreductase [Actinomycetota bacterium]
MRIFLSGASGVIGRRLVPMLVERGHSVTGMTRTREKADTLRDMGAAPVVCDVLDAAATGDAVAAARPEAVIQHLTDLPPDLNPRNLKRAYAANDRVRSEGSANLVAAAKAAGIRRYLAQNVCFAYRPEGGVLKDEEAPIFTDAPPPFDRTARIYLDMERRVAGNGAFEGLVLRFGFWYGPGTSYARDGYLANEVRRRRFPIIGDGTGVFSFVHIDDVALATIAALEGGSPGIYNVCDDDPAPVHEWLPVYAEILGAKSPYRVPRWLGRLLGGSFAALMMTELRGASNHKAKHKLGWEPRYPTWRDGFREALG